MFLLDFVVVLTGPIFFVLTGLMFVFLTGLMLFTEGQKKSG
jgi:hypothetical protein